MTPASDDGWIPQVLELTRGMSNEDLELLIDELPPAAQTALLEALQASESPDPLDIDLQPHQTPPHGDWVGWLLRAGRRAGKSYACAAYVAKYVRDTPGELARMRLIAPTFDDAVQSCIFGPSGLLRLDPSATWHPSAPGGSVVRWPSGAELLIIGTNSPRDVERLRASGGRSLDWFEEAAANSHLVAAFEQAELGRNLGPSPRWIASTTPRPLPIFKTWDNDPDVRVTTARTRDNKTLTQQYLDTLDKRYKGTRLYAQEVEGEVLEDVEGALWVQADIDRSMVAVEHRQEILDACVRRVVGVDPPSGNGTCGIVVVGATRDGLVYVLADYSVSEASPGEWAAAVSQAAKDYNAAVVAEINQGGKMVTAVLREQNKALPVSTVHAAKGKQARAEPVAMLWEADEQAAGMAPESEGSLAKLTDQMTGWVPGAYSPDLLDAMVWAVTHLREGSGVAEARQPSATRAVGSPVAGGLSAIRRGRWKGPIDE